MEVVIMSLTVSNTIGAVAICKDGVDGFAAVQLLAEKNLSADELDQLRLKIDEGEYLNKLNKLLRPYYKKVDWLTDIKQSNLHEYTG